MSDVHRILRMAKGNIFVNLALQFSRSCFRNIREFARIRVSGSLFYYARLPVST